MRLPMPSNQLSIMANIQPLDNFYLKCEISAFMHSLLFVVHNAILDLWYWSVGREQVSIIVE